MNRHITSGIITNAHPELFRVLKDSPMDYDSIIARFESLADPEARDGMAQYGITGKKIYGISIPVLRKLAKEAGKPDHAIALRLWTHGP